MSLVTEIKSALKIKDGQANSNQYLNKLLGKNGIIKTEQNKGIINKYTAYKVSKKTIKKALDNPKI